MTTARTPQVSSPFRLPDPPERRPEDMTSFKHLAGTGNAHYLKQHFGRPESTIVSGELFLALDRRRGPGVEFRVPDLLIAFNADPQLYEANNGYVVSEQGKPPDFVLEIASPGTRAQDNTVKREFYVRHRVAEYWRFDEEDAPGRVRLAGDRLAEGRYEPMAIEGPEEGVLQGYSAALDLHLRWERGQLRWHDPATGRHIATLDSEREARAAEREARIREREARLAAEARARELAAELQRLRGG